MPPHARVHDGGVLVRRCVDRRAELEAMPNLTKLELNYTGVKGDVAGLAPLIHLTELYLRSTKVKGDLGKLKALQGR